MLMKSWMWPSNYWVVCVVIFLLNFSITVFFSSVKGRFWYLLPNRENRCLPRCTLFIKSVCFFTLHWEVLYNFGSPQLSCNFSAIKGYFRLSRVHYCFLTRILVFLHNGIGVPVRALPVPLSLINQISLCLSIARYPNIRPHVPLSYLLLENIENIRGVKFVSIS